MYEIQKTPQPGRPFAASSNQQHISQPKIQQFNKSTNENVHKVQKLPLQQTSENPLPEKSQVEKNVNVPQHDQRSSQTTLNDQSIKKQVREVHQIPNQPLPARRKFVNFEPKNRPLIYVPSEMQKTSETLLPEKPKVEETVNVRQLDQRSSQTTLNDHSKQKQVPEVHQIPNQPLPARPVDKHSLEAILPTSTIKEQPLPNETLQPQNVVPMDRSKFFQSAQNYSSLSDSPEIQPSLIEAKNGDASINPFNVQQTLNIPSINERPNENQLNQSGGYERSKDVIDTSSNNHDFADLSIEKTAAIPNPSDSTITKKEPLQRSSETKTSDDTSKPVASVVIPQFQFEPKHTWARLWIAREKSLVHFQSEVRKQFMDPLGSMMSDKQEASNFADPLGALVAKSKEAASSSKLPEHDKITI
uniref:Uncharacterized protein n=1 Tax=Panagrolaimus sp. PS1159 TaxID=55785 RepID=A0AC35FXZ2_9BILA